MAASYICKTFAHSPVFRIGGDEFVAILKGSDYENRDTLVMKFERDMSKEKLDIEPFSVLSIAYGMAEQICSQNYETVARLADNRMYDKKKLMKSGNL